jgi:hypothetical protein
MNNISNYNFLKSKTFWTIIFLFAFNGFSAISTQVPANVVLVVDAVFSTLATVFHISGVNSAVSATLQGGHPLSGQ